MMRTWSFLCVILMQLLKVSSMEEVENCVPIEKNKDTRRPIWNIVRMEDRLEDVNKPIDRGANAMAAGIYITSEGEATDAYFGRLCSDCAKDTSFVKYLEYMRKLTSPDSDGYRDRLILLYMDCYVNGLSSEARVKAGEDVATKLVDHFWEKGESGARAFILIAIETIDDINFMESIKSTLKKTGNFTFYEKRIGYDFHGLEDLDNIEAAYKKSDLGENIWQGDGIAEKAMLDVNRLEKCINRREENSSYIRKVYFYTLDRRDYMEEVLWNGIDGFLTNKPELVKRVLEQYEYKRAFRLATHQDATWEKYTFEIPD